jgi:hypothetical protein
MLEVVKMTHVYQYWRSTLISYPHLWSSIFVGNSHKGFAATCLERSREAPLTARLDLEHGDYYLESTPVRQTDIEGDPSCHYRAMLAPLLEADCIRRIRKLDVHLIMEERLKEDGENDPEEIFRGALDDFGFFEFPLPVLENLNFHVIHEVDHKYPLELPEGLFGWGSLPPATLRHLALHGCFGGPFQEVRDLTSFELDAYGDTFDPESMELDQHTFAPFISGNPSLVSLHLVGCSFPDDAWTPPITPAKLLELKSLQLTETHGLPNFPNLVDVPAFKTLSSLRISARKRECSNFGSYLATDTTNFLVRAEGHDGFQLSYQTLDNREVASDWLGITRGAGPTPAFVRFEGRERDLTKENEMEVSPLPLFVNAEVLEIGASFASLWYRDFWKDLEKVGPQLTTLRLEIIEGMKSSVAKSVKKLVKARFQKGTPLIKLERMTFEEMSEEDDEEAKKLWEEFRVGLNVDQYLAA